MIGLEPITCWLQISCSANWATSAFKWMEKDSNLRRRCQQIYSLPPLATRESNHIYFKHLNHNIIMTRCEAVDRTWTGNLLITNQLLCQLSHNGMLDDITHLWIVMTPTGFEPVLPPWKGGVLTTWPWSLIPMTASRSMQYLKYYETPRAGLEPATARLTAVCSTNWAIEDYYKVYSYYIIYLQNNIQESLYISYTSAFFG